MGTIASVLQWTCKKCNFINPTECMKCLKCGNRRLILDKSHTAKFNHQTTLINDNIEKCDNDPVGYITGDG